LKGNIDAAVIDYQQGSKMFKTLQLTGMCMFIIAMIEININTEKARRSSLAEA
jgi:hypothetical protein